MSRQSYTKDSNTYDVQCEHCMSFDLEFTESGNNENNNNQYYELYDCNNCGEETTLEY